MMPTEEDVQKAAGSSFWLFTIALWLILLSCAVTTGLCLLIWTMLEAF